MTKRNFLLYALSFWAVCGYAQFTSRYYLDGKDKELKYDSLIRSRFSTPVPSSYFVITYPLKGGVTTFGPQFIKAYTEIKNSKQNKASILVVFSNEGGMRKQDINPFIKFAFHIDASEISYILDDELYETLNGPGLLMRLMYFYRGKPLFNSVPKLYDFPGDQLLYEQVNLKLKNAVQLSGADSTFIQESDELVAYSSKTLLIQGEVRDAFYSLNIETGAINKFFSLHDHLTAWQSYCTLFSGGDTAKCQFALQYDSLLTSSHRQALNVDGVKVNNGVLSGFFGTEAFEKTEKAFSYRNDENKKITVPAGSPDLSAFQGYFEYHSSTKKLNLYRVDFVDLAKYELYIAPTASYYVLNDSQLLTDILYYPYGKNQPLLCVLQKKESELVIQKYLEPKISKKEYDLAESNNDKTFYFEFGNSIYFCMSIFPNIYKVNSSDPVSRLYGDMTSPYKEEVYRTYAQDTVTVQNNFRIRTISPILDGRYLAIYYTFKNSHIMEIKDQNFHTIDILFLDQLEGFNHYAKGKQQGSWNVLISNDHFYFTFLNNNEFYLNEYEFVSE